MNSLTYFTFIQSMYADVDEDSQAHTEFCVLYNRYYCSNFCYFGLLSGSVFWLMETTCHFRTTFYALCKNCSVQRLKCNSLQYSCLEKPMDREAWRAAAHGVARVRHDLVTKSPTTLSYVSNSSLGCLSIK